MDKIQFKRIYDYMCACLSDSAHDRDHVERVLHTALVIGETEAGVDMEVLVCACLLHDIGRKEQYEDPKVCHARVGGEKAYCFLRKQGFSDVFARKVQACIVTHRFRENNQPQSLEAKILFDADKLDVAGALGIARTLLYQGYVGEPLYTRLPNGDISDGSDTREPSFFREYKFKLEKLYSRFYTEKGRELAATRRQTAEIFYQRMLKEVREIHGAGAAALETYLRQQN